MLAMRGLRRAGRMGIDESTTGRALIGAKLGRLIDAVVDEAIGFAAGIVQQICGGRGGKVGAIGSTLIAASMTPAGTRCSRLWARPSPVRREP